MVIGYRKIYGDGIVVVNNLCRSARANNIVYRSYIFLCATYSWACGNLQYELEDKNKRKKSKK